MSIGELASKYGVSDGAMREKVRKLSGYRVVGDKLVNASFLNEIKSEVKGVSYEIAKEKMERYGLSIDLILNELGLRVEWKGLEGGEIQS